MSEINRNNLSENIKLVLRRLNSIEIAIKSYKISKMHYLKY